MSPGMPPLSRSPPLTPNLLDSHQRHRPRHFQEVSLSPRRRLGPRKGLAHLPQHRTRLLGHGSRFPRPRRQGTQECSGVLEDLRRVPQYARHGRRDCDGDAGGDAVGVSSFTRAARCEADDVGRVQRSEAVRSQLARRGLRQGKGPHAVSGRPLGIVLGLEGERDWQEPGQRQDVLGEAVRSPSSLWNAD